MPVLFDEPVYKSLFGKKNLRVTDAEITYGKKTLTVTDIRSVSRIIVVNHGVKSGSIRLKTDTTTLTIRFSMFFRNGKNMELFERGSQAVRTAVLEPMAAAMRGRFLKGETVSFGKLSLDRAGVRLRRYAGIFIRTGETTCVPYSRLHTELTDLGLLTLNSLDDPSVHYTVSLAEPNAELIPLFLDWAKENTPGGQSRLIESENQPILAAIARRNSIKAGAICLLAGGATGGLNYWTLTSDHKYYVISSALTGPLLVAGAAMVLFAQPLGALKVAAPMQEKKLKSMALVPLGILAFFSFRFFSEGMDWHAALFLN